MGLRGAREPERWAGFGGVRFVGDFCDLAVTKLFAQMFGKGLRGSVVGGLLLAARGSLTSKAMPESLGKWAGPLRRE